MWIGQARILELDFRKNGQVHGRTHKIMVSIKSLALCGAVIGVSGTALAEINLYAGAEVGYADIELEELKDSESYQGYLGFAYNNLVGLEVGYGSLGEYEAKVGGGRSSVEVDSVMQASIAFHGPLLVFEKARVHARYGYYEADLTPHIPNGRAQEKTSRDVTYALGVSYPIVKALSVSATWQFFNEVDNQKINTYSAGLRLDF